MLKYIREKKIKNDILMLSLAKYAKISSLQFGRSVENAKYLSQNLTNVLTRES